MKARTKKKAGARVGVHSRKAAGKPTSKGTQIFRETYKRRRRSSVVTRNTKSKVSEPKRMAMQTAKRQTASGKAQDSDRAARAPGKRISSSNKVYTETRRNRSDAGRFK